MNESEIGDHYEEFRLGAFRVRKSRIPTEKCIYDEYYICFDKNKDCEHCRHKADLLSKIIP